MSGTDRPYGYTWAFVAMEYWALILNRVYCVFVGDRTLSGAFMGGPIVERPRSRRAWRPEYWLPPQRLQRYNGVNVSQPEFLSASWANFQRARTEIADVVFNRRPKWGMGTCPYSGRIHITWSDGREQELILLGRQDGPAIRDRLLPPHVRLSVGSEDAVPRPTFIPLGGVLKPGLQHHSASYG